jgi:hypothetical protein
MRACTASSPLCDPMPPFPVTHDQCSHWLALAGVASFFTQKSRAAILFASNAMIIRCLRYPSDIFDSHRPLHSKATSGVQTSERVCPLGPK